jgi:hypothetical protein
MENCFKGPWRTVWTPARRSDHHRRRLSGRWDRHGCDCSLTTMTTTTNNNVCRRRSVSRYAELLLESNRHKKVLKLKKNNSFKIFNFKNFCATPVSTSSGHWLADAHGSLKTAVKKSRKTKQ